MTLINSFLKMVEVQSLCGIPFEQRWSRFNEALEIFHKLWISDWREEEDDDDDGDDNAKSNTPTPSYIDYAGRDYQLEKISG